MTRAVEPIQPFDELRELPQHLRVGVAFAVACAVVAAAGVALGIVTPATHPAQTLLASTCYCGAGLYLVISLVDFREHFLLERALTGRFFATRALPLGETLNHAGSVSIVILTLALPQPLSAVASLDARDSVALLLPLAFLALGLRDELVYHRRRAAHREDILHTTAHLCAGTFFTTWVALRLVPWPLLAPAH